MSSLVVVESPAKCKKIASYLGSGFTVIASMGHIRALEESLDAIGLDTNFELRYTFLKEKAKALQALQNAAKGVETIYLAADDDREGEAIAYSVAVYLRRDPLQLPRIVFHEITQKAIRAAVANPRRIDMNKVNAQQARAVLDMMVGFTISPLLWKYVAPSLSAGRCQTPALRLVCDREHAIQSHTTTSSWKLKGSFTGGPLPFDAFMNDELDDQESALNYLENVHQDSPATVTSVETTPWSTNPPKPLITSTLQQEASALFHMNPKTTMRVAQTLYESGFITYMRTDSIAMSEEARAAGREWIQDEHGEPYLGPAAPPSPNAPAKQKKKKDTTEAAPPAAQEAHECIRPTQMALTILPGTPSPEEKKVYQLIWRRAIQSLMAPAKGLTRTLTLQLNADSDTFPWSTSWKKTTFQGWKILGATANHDDDSDNDQDATSTWDTTAKFQPNSKLNWTSLTATPKYSKAQPRYTEATLIRELEQKGIGRPSTFAALIETLLDKQYVEKRDIPGSTITANTLQLTPQQWPPTHSPLQLKQGAEKQKLVPTALGKQTLAFCVKEFPALFDYMFTAKMEQQLDAVAKGDAAWKDVCAETWNSYKEHYSQLKSTKSTAVAAGKQRDFGDGLKVILSKKGPLLLQESLATGDSKETTFYSFPPNAEFQTITEEQARTWIQQQEQEKSQFGDLNGTPILKKKGAYGEYISCGSLTCPYTPGDTREDIIKRLVLKQQGQKDALIRGPFTIKIGPYGPYLFKTANKQKQFVSVPANLELKDLTADDCDAIYKAGLEKKTAGPAGPTGRGGRGGRGGFAGRGRGRGRGGSTTHT
jgi:DNA topoisomerase I